VRVQLKLQQAASRRLGTGLLAICGVAGVVAPSFAEQQVDSGYHYFADSNGNSIDSYTMNVFQGVTEAWHLAVRGALDRVHLPPLAGLPGSRENVDAITAASRPVRSAAQSKEAFTKNRVEATGALVWQPHDRRIRGSGSYYYSHESDYVGQQVALELARDWNGGGTAVVMRTAIGFDRITPDEHTGGDPTARQRKTFDATATWVQSLTPVTQSHLGVEVNSVQGFQSNPYRHVYAGGQSLPERHPEERLRTAVFGQIDRYLTTRSSVSLGGRYYGDDWGIHAGTADLMFNQYIGDHLIVRYRYRRYMQTAASFYRELYATEDGIDGYRTADYKLQEFASNLFGIKVSVPFEGWVGRLDGLLLDLKYERYFDSHSFAANVLETGFSWPF
jgi:hypothetical protein